MVTQQRIEDVESQPTKNKCAVLGDFINPQDNFRRNYLGAESAQGDITKLTLVMGVGKPPIIGALPAHPNALNSGHNFVTKFMESEPG